MAAEVGARLPEPGQRVAIIGCGTSYYIAQAVAGHPRVARHRRDRRVRRLGDAEYPPLRPGRGDLALGHDDRGRAARSTRCPPGAPSLAISAVPGTPVVRRAGDAVLLRVRRRDLDRPDALRHHGAGAAARTPRRRRGTGDRRRRAGARRRPLPVEPAGVRPLRLPRPRLDASGSRTRPRSSSARRPAPGPSPTRRWSTATGRSASRAPSTLVWFLAGGRRGPRRGGPHHRRVGAREPRRPDGRAGHAPAGGGGARPVPRPRPRPATAPDQIGRSAMR